eukprot:m.9992 g.9992  ORF g.9992 m.9992 type:complete len:87 (-) comp4257_c0_seq1:2257-2517(-)
MSTVFAKALPTGGHLNFSVKSGLAVLCNMRKGGFCNCALTLIFTQGTQQWQSSNGRTGHEVSTRSRPTRSEPQPRSQFAEAVPPSS